MPVTQAMIVFYKSAANSEMAFFIGLGSFLIFPAYSLAIRSKLLWVKRVSRKSQHVFTCSLQFIELFKDSNVD